jgi:galactokinase
MSSNGLSGPLKELIASACQRFEDVWGSPPIYCGYSPGRVNLIGEHTDYNEGLVFPMAITDYTVVVGAESASNTCTVETISGDVDLPKKTSFTLDEITAGLPLWANYVKGITSVFPKKLKPYNAVIASSVPLGGGLSSSAALEASTFLFLEALNGECTELTIGDKAKLCQKAEHEYAGMPCGVMDQLISLSGKKGHALLIDCRSLDSELIAIDSEDYSFLVINSNVKHELATTEYGQRRNACHQVASMLGKHSLRDVSMRELESSLPVLNDELYRIARHVVTEIERTADAAEALKKNDLIVFGTLMSQSHASLRDDYRVSCVELDEIVEIALETEGVLGARMTGGGFGGCVVSLIRSDRVEAVKESVDMKYRGKATFYTYTPADGGNHFKL